MLTEYSIRCIAKGYLKDIDNTPDYVREDNLVKLFLQIKDEEKRNPIDTKMIDWIENHVEEIYTVGELEKEYTCIEWIKNNDPLETSTTKASNLREAIQIAMKEQE